ncbi:F-box only protein 28 [Galendromus occidentalis]|uniref:F-box only protein 28 n=1 Tax=Galendromus occidentalis TaxID=34638 RepID=A0AAJ6QUA6_9ACAR|nr:F-box only protein 28 [Galendromus occidentalis]
MEHTELRSDGSHRGSSSCPCGITRKLLMNDSARPCTCNSKSAASGSESIESPGSSSLAYSVNTGGQPFSKLPREIIVYIFEFLNYDEIAQLRPVCKSFDDICKSMLNEGYYKMEKFHSDSLKKVKSQLPRRESERRTHRLARHGDILMAIETRLSLLSMTYGKFIEQNLCCFIPGRVIDEVRRIIKLVNTDQDPPRPHEVLQELRDISSMAMEHFDECIQPRLRAKITDRLSGGLSDPLLAAANLAIVEANDTVMGYRPGFRIASMSNLAPHYTGSVYQTIADHSRKVAKLESKTKELEKRIKEKDKKLQEISERLNVSNVVIEKLTGRVAEVEKQLVEVRSMLRKDSCEVATSRSSKFPADDLDVCELQPRAKKSRWDLN